jgi:hypothetical protein
MKRGHSSRVKFATRPKLLLLLSGLMLAGVSEPAVANPRPISDFLSQQGTYCLNSPSCDLFVPPSPNMVGWSGPPPSYTYFALVDYAGLANKYIIANGGASLGTMIDGSINERQLFDGRSEDSVTLHTRRALAWVSNDSSAFPGPLVFGHRVDEVLGGAQPALADCNLQVTFTNTFPGDTLPDLIQLLFAPGPGQELEAIGFSCTGVGAMADGTSAQLVIRETGTLTRTKGNGANADGFPAEVIALHPVGQ